MHVVCLLTNIYSPFQTTEGMQGNVSISGHLPPPSPLSFPSVCGSTVFLSCSLILSEAAVGCQPVKLKLWSPSLP